MVGSIVADDRYPRMWRVVRSDGTLSNMAGFARTRDAAKTIAARELQADDGEDGTASAESNAEARASALGCYPSSHEKEMTNGDSLTPGEIDTLAWLVRLAVPSLVEPIPEGFDPLSRLEVVARQDHFRGIDPALLDIARTIVRGLRCESVGESLEGGGGPIDDPVECSPVGTRPGFEEQH